MVSVTAFFWRMGMVQDRKYLLSIDGLLESDIPDEIWERCLAKLDKERQKKVKDVTNSKKRAENIGAGLLLQLAVLEAENQRSESEEASGGVTQIQLQVIRGKSVNEKQISNITNITLKEVLHYLEQSPHTPLPLEYTYGENGKPYFKNYPYYFNISHSGEYIFGVISENEVGVDIQQKKPLTNNRIAERFFLEEEKRRLEECTSEQEKERLFYRLWTEKEAYGKLTGEGIAPVLARSKNKTMEENRELPVIFEEIEIADYQLTVCKWKQESK